MPRDGSDPGCRGAGRRAATLDRVAALVADAAREGARLVVLPEAFVSGYLAACQKGAGYVTREEAEAIATAIAPLGS